MESFEIFSSLPLPDFNNIKKILLVGAGGKTGDAYTRLLLEHKKEVWLYDKNPAYAVPEFLQKEKVFKVGEKDFQDATILEKVEGVTLSPGVPLQQNIFLQACEKKIPVFSELEFSFSLLQNPVLSITGTDGKSTVTALTSHLLKALGQDAIACGNYGLPLSALLLSNYSLSPQTILCLELSSYQLELSRNLKSDVAVFLNLAPDHLNRYKNLREYGLAKWNILFSLKEGGVFFVNKELLPSQILWQPHPLTRWRKERNERVILIDEKHLRSQNLFWQNARCCLKRKLYDSTEPLCLTNIEELCIKGKHNHTNFLFAAEAVFFFAQKKQISEKVFAEKMRQATANFYGLPHRFEFLPVTDGDLYINDSKATTCQAVITALKNVNSPLYIFLGGKGKGEDYSVLRQHLVQAHAYVIAFGEIRYELEKTLKSFVPILNVCEKLKDALRSAQEHKAKHHPHESVTFLLSPAATSWDAFSSFEERGDYFRKLVLESDEK